MDGPENDASFCERRAVRPLSVTVVGAGIGGLAVALCMRKTGHNVGEYYLPIYLSRDQGRKNVTAFANSLHCSKNKSY